MVDPGKVPGLDQQSLWRAVATCAAGAGLFLLLHFYLHRIGYEILSEVALHVGIAFIVALILIIALEHSAKRASHREVMKFVDLAANNVFEGVFRRILPQEVFLELLPIMKADSVRADCSYLITLEKPGLGMPENYLLVHRETSFTVRNLLSYPIEYAVRSQGATHSELRIDRQSVHLAEGRNILLQSDGSSLLQHIILIPAMGEAQVYLAGQQLKAIESGGISFFQSSSVIGLGVEIRNDYPERIHHVGINIVHPGRDELFTDDFGKYQFKRAILPGQGFEVVWQWQDDRRGSGST